MKTYAQLSESEQRAALEKALKSLLESIFNGTIRFNDELNADDLQARIDTAIELAEAKRTPWFAHEYVLDTCREELEGMAMCDAEEALYSEPRELVVSGIVTPRPMIHPMSGHYGPDGVGR